MFEKKIKENFIKMQEWLKQPLGKYLLKLETANVIKVSQRLYGHESLVIGNFSFINCLPKDRIRNLTLLNHDTNLSLEDIKKNNINAIRTKEYKLPIVSESIDIVYLAHALEVTSNPHEVLREVYRVLRPEGYLIITCFNPVSLFGLAKLILYFTNKCPWTLKFISKIKVVDWLKLLGFDIFQTENYLHNIPVNSQKYLDKVSTVDNFCNKIHLPFSASYLVLACKRMMTLTPIMPAWKTKKSIIRDSVIVPTPNVEPNNMKKDSD